MVIMLVKIKKNLDDFNKLKQLHIVQAALILTFEFSKLFWMGIADISFLLLLFWPVFYRLFHLTLFRLSYTFWSFGLISLLHSVISIIIFSNTAPIGLLFLLFGHLSILMIEFYSLSSPLFYPWINWWEYDFRYRHDLRVEVQSQDQSYEGRLTDLRRESGCVQLFEHLQIGSSIKIKIKDSTNTIFDAEVVTKREQTLGRSHSYGVKFTWDNKTVKDEYSAISSNWRYVHKLKKQEKFSNDNDSRDNSILQ